MISSTIKQMIATTATITTGRSSSIRLLCWNILAEIYNNKKPASKGEGNKPKHNHKNDEKVRKEHIRAIIQQMNADIVCLQEVDCFDSFHRLYLANMDYVILYKQRPTKQDGCVLAFKKQLFEAVDIQEVDFDRIGEGNSVQKKNVGIVVCLRRLEDQKLLIVSNCHLYWNPNVPQLKLAQSMYLNQCIYETSQRHQGTSADALPVIACGDYNSLPNSQVFQYFTNTQPVHESIEQILRSCYDSEKQKYMTGNACKFLCDHSLSRLCRWMRILGIDAAIQSTDGSKTYYDNMKAETRASLQIITGNSNSSNNSESVVESNITVDATTTNGNSSSSSKSAKLKVRAQAMDEFFAKAKRENRVILTTSKQMVERSTCPASYLIPSSRLNNLEQALADLCRVFSLKLNPDRFLTVCGKCGGEIVLCDVPATFYTPENNLKSATDNNDSNDNNNNTSDEGALLRPASQTSAAVSATESGKVLPSMNSEEQTQLYMQAKNIQFLPQDRPVYICRECRQPYWWNDKASSSPARAMRMADHLFRTVQTHLDSTTTTTTSAGISKSATVTATVIEEKSDEDENDVGEVDDVEEEDAASSESDVDLLNVSLQELATATRTAATSDNVKLQQFFQKRDDILSKPKQTVDEALAVSDTTTDTTTTTATAPVITPSIPLWSAYGRVHGCEPTMTNWCGGFRGTLDYAFVSAAVTVLDATVVPHTNDDAQHKNNNNNNSSSNSSDNNSKEDGLDAFRELLVTEPQPSQQWPSDHFAILTHLQV